MPEKDTPDLVVDMTESEPSDAILEEAWGPDEIIVTTDRRAEP